MVNPFAVSSIILAITASFLAYIIFAYGRTRLHFVWGLFNLVVALWGGLAFFIGIEDQRQVALLLWRVTFVAISFIPVLNFHVVSILCNQENKVLLRVFYWQAIIFSLISLVSENFIRNVRLIYNSIWYDVPGPIYYVYFIVWILIVTYAHVILVLGYLKSRGRRKSQILYFFVGTALGFSGGISNFLPALGVDVYPFGNFTIPIYCLIVTYAILKYRLLDITVALTRAGVFFFIYSLVLGVPILLAFVFQSNLRTALGDDWWLVPFLTLMFLAVVGPFLFLFIQRKAENRIFQSQRRYQNTLRQASVGMGRIKDLKRLLSLIVHIVNRTVRLEHTVVYIYSRQQKKYVLGAQRSRTVRFKPPASVSSQSPVIRELMRQREPIVYEEIKQMTEDTGDVRLARIEAEMKHLKAELVIPSFIEDNLIAVLVLGRMVSGRMYTTDDLAIFSILANQAALAIENAMFYEEMKQTHAQLLRAEKMATIGTLADGLSHQINNRLHALGFIAGDALDTLKFHRERLKSPEVADIVVDVEHALSRIQENITAGGEIVQGLLRYTRKTSEGFGPVELDKVLSAALEMTQFKIKPGEIHIIRDFDGRIPPLRANFTQLQEVLFNMIDNAYDAMMERKRELKEEGYQPEIRISVPEVSNGHITIQIEDNGMGIKPEDKTKLFTPFFTTKASSKKGTGLGLYVIQKLIEENHGGRVRYESTYKKGTRVSLYLRTWA